LFLSFFLAKYFIGIFCNSQTIEYFRLKIDDLWAPLIVYVLNQNDEAQRYPQIVNFQYSIFNYSFWSSENPK